MGLPEQRRCPRKWTDAPESLGIVKTKRVGISFRGGETRAFVRCAFHLTLPAGGGPATAKPLSSLLCAVGRLTGLQGPCPGSQTCWPHFPPRAHTSRAGPHFQRPSHPLPSSLEHWLPIALSPPSSALGFPLSIPLGISEALSGWARLRLGSRMFPRLRQYAWTRSSLGGPSSAPQRPRSTA